MRMNHAILAVAAITVAGHEKAILRPACSSNCPMTLRRPNNNSRKKPTTVGGKTRGNASKPSTSPRARPLYRLIANAAAMPDTNARAVDAAEVLSEIHKGERSDGITAKPL